jgi:hypothetical protein
MNRCVRSVSFCRDGPLCVVWGLRPVCEQGPVGRLLEATVTVAGLTSMVGVGAGRSALPPQPWVAHLAPES